MKTLFFSFNFKRKRTYMDRDRERLTGIGHWQSSASSRMTASAIGNDLFVTAARNVQKRLASFICFAFDCNAFAFVSQNNLVGYSSFFFVVATTTNLIFHWVNAQATLLHDERPSFNRHNSVSPCCSSSNTTAGSWRSCWQCLSQRSIMNGCHDPRIFLSFSNGEEINVSFPAG